MLYAIQQTTSVIKVRAKLEAQLEMARAAQSQTSANLGGPQLPAVGNCGDQSNAQTGNLSRVHAYSGFEQEFSISAGKDIDAEIHWTLIKADEEAELRHAEAPPPPPPGIRFGSAQHRLYREEVYQGLNMQINRMKHELRDHYEQKRKESEKQVEALKKEMLSAKPPQPLATSA
jgi:hypothetical protein